MIRLLLLIAAALAPAMAPAQALPTASQLFELSVFGGATGTWTGLPPYYDHNGEQGRNIGITAGVNLAFPIFAHFQPSVEVRGTYPVKTGSVDAQETALAGGKIERRFGRLRPYGDFFYGRGRVDYENGGYPSANGAFIYLYTDSSVYSPGGGVDLDLTDHFAAKFDFQYQRFATPAAASGHIYGKPLTAALIYRFDFNHHFKYTRDGMVRERAPQAPPPPRPNAKNPPPPAPDAAQPPPPAPDVAQPATPPTDTAAPAADPSAPDATQPKPPQ